MGVITPPGFNQGASYSAKLDRLYNNTAPAWADMNALVITARQGFYSGHVPAFINAGLNITMGPCMGIIRNTFASASGDYTFASDSNTVLVPAAAHVTLNRYDILGYQVKDNFYDGSGLNNLTPVIIQGANFAGTPSDPALPNAFIPVLRAVMSAGTTSPALQSMIVRTVGDGAVLPIGSVTERALLTNMWAGATIARTDKLWLETHDGTAWRAENGVLVTALADVTNPRVGQIAVLSTDNIAYRYNGSGWDAAYYTGRKPMGEWRRNANFNVVSLVDRKMNNWDTVITTPYEITHSAGNFTFARSGVYALTTSMRQASTTEFYVWWGKASDSNINRGKTGTKNPGTLNQTITTQARITAGDVWCVWYYTDVTVDVLRETATAEDYTPYAHIRYLDPL